MTDDLKLLTGDALFKAYLGKVIHCVPADALHTPLSHTM